MVHTGKMISAVLPVVPPLSPFISTGFLPSMSGMQAAVAHGAPATRAPVNGALRAPGVPVGGGDHYSPPVAKPRAASPGGFFRRCAHAAKFGLMLPALLFMGAIPGDLGGGPGGTGGRGRDGFVHMDIARRKREAGERRDAVFHFNEAAKVFMREGMLAEAAKAYINMGWEYERAGDIANAERYYAEAVGCASAKHDDDDIIAALGDADNQKAIVLGEALRYQGLARLRMPAGTRDARMEDMSAARELFSREANAQRNLDRRQEAAHAKIREAEATLALRDAQRGLAAYDHAIRSSSDGVSYVPALSMRLRQIHVMLFHGAQGGAGDLIARTVEQMRAILAVPKFRSDRNAVKQYAETADAVTRAALLTDVASPDRLTDYDLRVEARQKIKEAESALALGNAGDALSSYESAIGLAEGQSLYTEAVLFRLRQVQIHFETGNLSGVSEAFGRAKRAIERAGAVTMFRRPERVRKEYLEASGIVTEEALFAGGIPPDFVLHHAPHLAPQVGANSAGFGVHFIWDVISRNDPNFSRLEPSERGGLLGRVVDEALALPERFFENGRLTIEGVKRAHRKAKGGG